MDKPFLTFSQQIEKLRNDGLIITNESFAEEMLKSISYYDLVNGYKAIFMKNDKFINNTSFEQLFSMHVYNKNIQGVLMKYSIYAENSFKTVISYVVAESFSEDNKKYLNINNFAKSRNPDKRLALKELIALLNQLCIKCGDNPTKHYIATKNHVPPWILFRNVSFSNISSLFDNLKPNEKNSIADTFTLLNASSLRDEEKIRILASSLRMVRRLRNRIAHNLDFLCYKNAKLDKKAFEIFEHTLINSTELDRENNDIWCLILAITILLNNQYLIYSFLMELSSYLNSNSVAMGIYCQFSGIPIDFEERIKRFLG